MELLKVQNMVIEGAISQNQSIKKNQVLQTNRERKEGNFKKEVEISFDIIIHTF